MKSATLSKQTVKLFIITCLTLFFLVGIGKFAFYLYGLNGLIDGMFPLAPVNHTGLSGIYARPLEIKPGLHLSPDDLALELSLLNYRKRSFPDTPGSYLNTANAVTIYSRSIIVNQTRVNPKKIRVSFDSNRVASIVDMASGEPLSKLPLEPLRLDLLNSSAHTPTAFIPLSEVPDLLIKTLIAVEDQQFYTHHGADFNAVLRALWVNFRKGYVAQGGSTLTQQLARHLFFSRKQTVQRKLDETLTAILLELKQSKQDILEAYINTVYLGQDGSHPIKGFNAAGEFYFGRSARDLNLNEIATLVGMLKGPSHYNPARFPERATKRRNLVLKLLAQQKLIPHDLARATRNEKITLYEPQKHLTFPACVDLTRRHYNQHESTTITKHKQTVRVYTTIDPIVQMKVEEGVREGFKKIETNHAMKTDDLETGVVVVSVGDCNVLSVVGGKAFRFDGFNRAIDIRRPIGSLVKPAYYLAALEKPETYHLMTLLDNAPFTLDLGTEGTWTPRNFSSTNQGKVPLFEALSQSYNIASVRLGLSLGLENCIAAINKLGFEKPIKQYPAILLGSLSMSPFEVAELYHTLASGGRFAPIHVIDNVYSSNLNSNGRFQTDTKQFYKKKESRFSEDSIYLLNTILQKAVSEGTVGDRFQQSTAHLQAAGKTGTTDDFRDNWFAGFSGDKLVVVWVGKDDYDPTDLTGAQGAFILWDEIMSRISHTPFAPEKPKTIQWVDIDPQTGFKIEEDECEAALCLPYITGFQPKQTIPCQEAKQFIKDNPPFQHWLQGVFGARNKKNRR